MKICDDVSYRDEFKPLSIFINLNVVSKLYTYNKFQTFCASGWCAKWSQNDTNHEKSLQKPSKTLLRGKYPQRSKIALSEFLGLFYWYWVNLNSTPSKELKFSSSWIINEHKIPQKLWKIALALSKIGSPGVILCALYFAHAL